MYDFVDVGGQSSTGLPAVYMLVNGTAIEDEIEGYRTLNVSGRETIRKRLETETVKGRDGEIFISSDFSARTITVEYQLIAHDAEEFQNGFHKLKRFISADNLKLSFSDQPGFFYIGYLVEMKEVPKGLNAVASSIDFFCPQPFSFGPLCRLYDGQRLAIQSAQKIEIERITIIPSETVNRLDITNGRQTISLKGAFKSSDVIVLELPKQIITHNGQLKMNLLDLRSDFENFEIMSGEAVRLPQNAKALIEYREVRL